MFKYREAQFLFIYRFLAFTSQSQFSVSQLPFTQFSAFFYIDISYALSCSFYSFQWLQKCWPFDVLLFMVFRSSSTNGFLPFSFYAFAVERNVFTVSVFYFINIRYKYASCIVCFRKMLTERFLALMEWKSHKEIAFDFIRENLQRNTDSSQVRLDFKKKVNEIQLFSFSFVSSSFFCFFIEMSQSDFLSIYVVDTQVTLSSTFNVSLSFRIL